MFSVLSVAPKISQKPNENYNVGMVEEHEYQLSGLIGGGRGIVGSASFARRVGQTLSTIRKTAAIKNDIASPPAQAVLMLVRTGSVYVITVYALL